MNNTLVSIFHICIHTIIILVVKFEEKLEYNVSELNSIFAFTQKEFAEEKKIPKLY